MTDGVTHRGNISQHVQSLPSSGIRRFFDLLASMDGVISLGVGQPDFVTPNHIRNAAIRSIEDGETYYTSNYGLVELRAAISRHLNHLYGVHYDPGTEIIVTSGVSEGLNIALEAILDPGDEVLSPDPGYVAYLPCVLIAGGTFIQVPTRAGDGFTLHPEEIERRITPRTKALLLGYPANPTGAVMTRDVLLAVAKIAEQHDLFVISDEIYDRLVYGTEHVCFSSLPGMRDRTILLGGFSKAYAMTGWRLAYTCARGELTEAMMKVHQYVMMSAPTPAQFAALEALRNGEEDVRGMVAEYDRRRQLVVSRLNAMGLPCPEPRGAFYAFPHIGSTGMNDETFAERLLMEQRVAVIPGSAFGEGGAGHVRICYANEYDRLAEAMDRMQEFVARHQVASK
ncbi:MAG TPA: aminotransferase class I/II-fold pyridoxal phosphate-dependent enzyme [Dehalococcoidia bacterium]|nr:aminotransferase class I/II-fold pyridoxal phosphate-dependent enzyme [Dehalococcoidia bacterium]